MTASKAFVIYVWDNEQAKVAAVFRAVGPGEGSGGEPLKQPIVFDIAKVGAFADWLSLRYPAPRYAVRDWLASSLEDFFTSRYGWTAEEFARHRPEGSADPFASDERSAQPVPLCDDRLWSPSGCESVTCRLGQKPGLPADPRVCDTAANAYDPSTRGYYAQLTGMPDLWLCGYGATTPRFWTKVSAVSHDEARDIFLQRLLESDIAPEDLAGALLPAGEEEAAARISARYPESHPILAADDVPKRFHCEWIDRTAAGDRNVRAAWVVTHRTNCSWVFAPEQMHQDEAAKAAQAAAASREAAFDVLNKRSAEYQRKLDSEKAFVLYVWDNKKQRIASVFRAVGPGAGAGEAPSKWLPWLDKPPCVFDIAKIAPFVDRLRRRYPEPRYAIRDWRASSLENFFVSRYRWTCSEFALHRPRGIEDPFASKERSAKPIALCDYNLWRCSGREDVIHRLGQKAGLPADPRRCGEAERDFVDQKRFLLAMSVAMPDLRLHGLQAESPRFCTEQTFDFLFRARVDFLDRLLQVKRPEQIMKAVAPTDEKEAVALFQSSHKLYYNYTLPDNTFFFETAGGKGGHKLFTAMTHRGRCSRAFASELICPDFGSEVMELRVPRDRSRAGMETRPLIGREKGRTLILYVWDNETRSVADVFRGIVHEDMGQESTPGEFPRVFDATHFHQDTRKFVDRVHSRYPTPRYALRDWLAYSLEDFFATRYGWTAEEFARHRPVGLADPFAAHGRPAEAALLCNYGNWMPYGIETVSVSPGRKPGIFPDGGHASGARSETSAPTRIQAQLLFMEAVERAGPKAIRKIVVPRHEKEFHAWLAPLFPGQVAFSSFPWERRFYLEARKSWWRGVGTTWVGNHKTVCAEVFSPDLLCPDYD